jgi:hypothetical protein
MHCLIMKKGRDGECFRQSRTQGEAEERNADIARAVSLGRRGM